MEVADSLVELVVRHCLARGRITVFEGIFRSARYQQMCERLITGHDGPSLVYYLDVSLPETLRRHSLKPIADHVSDEQVAPWYGSNDVLALPGEVILDERHSEDELVARILGDREGLAP